MELRVAQAYKDIKALHGNVDPSDLTDIDITIRNIANIRNYINFLKKNEKAKNNIRANRIV